MLSPLVVGASHLMCRHKHIIYNLLVDIFFIIINVIISSFVKAFVVLALLPHSAAPPPPPFMFLHEYFNYSLCDVPAH